MIVSTYACFLGLLFLLLSLYTIRGRWIYRVSMGDGGNNKLLRRIRVHANFAEYVPISLLLLFFAEVEGAKPVLLHSLGIALLVGRLFHAYAIGRESAPLFFRSAGMMLTFVSLLGSILFLLSTRLW